MRKFEDNVNFKANISTPIIVDQKQLENVKYFKYLCRVIKNDNRYTRKIITRMAIQKKLSTRRRPFL
jgi:hypothetical protein